MSYRTINLSECVISDPSYTLCYIERIPETIWDYDEESKALISSPNFNDGMSGWLQMSEQKNPEYIEGVSTLRAYFSPIPLKDISGDDWDDIPYETNSGCPYDDVGGKEYEVIVLTFGICNTRVWVKLPDDYSGYCGSPFSVQSINLGAIPWIFAKGQGDGVSIMAGTTIEEFINKINKIKEL